MGKAPKTDLNKSIGSSYVLFLATNLVALFLTPFILRYVTKQEYGLYVLCVELFTWMGFLNLGTAKVLGPTVAKELAKDNSDDVIYLFNSSFWFQLAVSFLAIPLYYGLVSFADAKSAGVENYQILILIFAFAAFVQNMSGQFSEMIIATRKIHLDNRIQLIMLILRLLLIVALVPLFGIEVVFAIYFLISLFDISRKYYRVRKLYPKLQIKLKLYSKSHFKELLSNGVFFTLASITTILVTKFDQFFLGKEVGLEVVASYYVSIKLIQIGEKLVNVLFNNLRPHISRFHGQKDLVSIRKIYLESSAMMMLIGSVYAIVLILVNKYFVTFWVGEELYLGDRFNTYVVLFYLLNLITLPSRIILISTLSYIRNLTISGFFQGMLRFGILYIGFSTMEILVLPVSNLIALFLFGFCYQMLLISKYFENVSDIKITNWVLVASLFGVVVIPFIQLSVFIPLSIIALGATYLLAKNNVKKGVVSRLLFS